MKPWEKYAGAATATKPKGPWEKYGEAQPVTPPTEPQPEESWATRTAKALAPLSYGAAQQPAQEPRPYDATKRPSSFADMAGATQDPSFGAAPIFDALSLPARTLATTRDMEMSDPGANVFNPEIAQAEQNAKAQNEANPWNGRAPTSFADFGQNAFAAPGQVALAAGGDPLTWTAPVSAAARKAGPAIVKMAEMPNQAAGKLAQELSNVSEEALRMAGTKEGRAALQANAGKEYEIGQKLVGMLDNPSEYAPNKIQIDNALKGMGEIDISPAIKALQDAKVRRGSGILFAHEKAANDAIQQDINDLLGVNGRRIHPAAEVRDLRMAMDQVIDHSGNQKQLAIVNNAKLKARKVMRDLLENKALETGNDDYIQGINALHKQLDARDRLSAFLGKNKEAREDRAESFIANMWGKNKKNRQRVMADIEEAFGKNFVDDSKLANLAAQLGEEGKAGFYSRSSTGRSKLGGMVTFPFSSPMVASRITLPLAKLPADVARKVFLLGEKLRQAKTPAEELRYVKALEKIGLSPEEILATKEMVKGSGGEDVFNRQELIVAPSREIPKPQAPTNQIPVVTNSPTATPATQAGGLEWKMAGVKRRQAEKYLQATLKREPNPQEVQDFLKANGDKDIPKPPEREIQSREFKGRRTEREFDGLDNLMKNGDPQWETVQTPVTKAPESFTIGGMELKRTKGQWDNQIVYKDKQGKKYTFRGDETIHMDAPKAQSVTPAPEAPQVKDDFIGEDGQPLFQSSHEAGIPEGRANDPKVIEAAAKAWKEKGTESPFFKRWFKGSKVIDKDGKPIAVYHGTTHKFDAFSDETANIENHYGKGFYFTDAVDDADVNYKGIGPDLKNRIENRTEQILSENDISWSGSNSKEYKKAFAKAKKELYGGKPATLETYVKMENPVIVKDENPTRFSIEYNEETSAETGNGIDLYNALIREANRFDADGQQIWNDISENIDINDFTAKEFDEAFRKSEAAAYIEDPQTGKIAGSELLKETYRSAGFDGIVMDAGSSFGRNRKFGKGMDGVEGATHYIAFDPNQIKSATGNRGTFNPKDPSILNQSDKLFSPKGQIIRRDGRSTITLYKGKADASTALHEHAHWMRLNALTADESERALKAIGKKEWSREAEEDFAKGYEKYLFRGESPTDKLRPHFETMKKSMRKIYLNGEMDDELPQGLKEVYDAVFIRNQKISKRAETILSKLATSNKGQKVALMMALKKELGTDKQGAK